MHRIDVLCGWFVNYHYDVETRFPLILFWLCSFDVGKSTKKIYSKLMQITIIITKTANMNDIRRMEALLYTQIKGMTMFINLQWIISADKMFEIFLRIQYTYIVIKYPFKTRTSQQILFRFVKQIIIGTNICLAVWRIHNRLNDERQWWWHSAQFSITRASSKNKHFFQYIIFYILYSFTLLYR